ncbi:MAG: DUF1295 domain-containing protein [Coriobacteriia bacterium]|nr:DUF1295 domain-containing protein [Coriobacteriia bacterium]
MKAERTALISLLAAVCVGVGIAAAGSRGGHSVGGVPVFALAVGVAFLVQWLAFVPAYLLQTEQFYDLTGSLTYVGVITMAAMLGPRVDARSVVLWALVVIWAARLGTFLFGRVRKAGKDSRFDEIRPSSVRFLNAWTVQGLWVSLTMAAALAAITSAERMTEATASPAWLDVDAFLVAGLLVWVAGFAIEVVADAQKRRFRAEPANSGRFISTGLWSWSRHPNYFGEIVLWTGVAVIAFPVLTGWQLVTLISPVFVYVLLTRASGVPLLERKADATWGGQEEYERYKARTPTFVPRPPRRSAGNPPSGRTR